MKDAFFHKKPRRPSARRHGVREPAPESYLIVTEGTKTEPGYFEGLKRYLEETYRSKQMTVRANIENKGFGRGTKKLLEEAERWIDYGKRQYQHVWLVFDRDGFPDFDQAVEEIEAHGYHAAWSNACFEFWLCLHVSYSSSGRTAAGWSDQFKKIMGPAFTRGSQKTDKAEGLFHILTADGGLGRAVRHAARLEAGFDGKRPSACDPGTTVHHLIQALSPYLGELLKEEQ